MPLSHRTCLAFALALLGAACATPPEGARPYWLKNNATVSAVDSMIAYHAYAWTLSGSEWQRENARLGAAARQPDESLCLRQAILAGVPAAPERARAASQFEQCERELRKRESRLLGLASLLRAEQGERLRADERQRDANRRAEELAQKLNDLKAIEKTLLERNPTAPRKKTP